MKGQGQEETSFEATKLSCSHRKYFSEIKKELIPYGFHR